MTGEAEDFQKPLARRLLAWYRKNKRDLPWRHTQDPYAIWISEIMLQQTQVGTVIPYYERFLKTFPSVKALAEAPLSSVLKAWENLGYYSRAKHLHETAKIIVNDLGGSFPGDREDLLKLPGIGFYTAGAIASIAFGQAFPAVDANVRRILCRIFAIEKSPKASKVIQSLEQLASELVPEKNPGEFNSAVMDLGAILCRPKAPRCHDCPLASLCRARTMGLENELPRVEKRAKIPHRQGVCAVIFDASNRLLVVQRPGTGLLASLWKLPGGFSTCKKDLPGELIRKVKEELDIEILPGEKLEEVNHTYTHFRLTLHAFDARLSNGSPRTPITCKGCQAFTWAGAEDLENLAFSRVDRMILEKILDLPGAI